MNFLKGFGTAVLSFLLFVSISVFSLAFFLNSTVLNQDFITRQVDRLDISALVDELADEELIDQIPPEIVFLQDSLINIVQEQEPWVKEQLDAAISAGYDYFLDRKDTLRMVVPLESRKQIIKDHLWRELNRLLAKDPELILGYLKPFVMDNVDRLSIAIPDLKLVPARQLSSFLDDLIRELAADIRQGGIPPEFSFIIDDVARPYFNRYYDELAADIPDELVLDESDIGADALRQIVQVKTYIGYFRAWYIWLIVLMVVLVAGTFLIHWNFAVPSRALGINLLIAGMLEIIGVLLARAYLPMEQFFADLPAALQSWLTALMDDLFRIPLTFGIVVAAIGVALIVVSIVFRVRRVE